MENPALHLLILGTVSDSTIVRSELLQDTSHVPVPKELPQRQPQRQTLGYFLSPRGQLATHSKGTVQEGCSVAPKGYPVLSTSLSA